MSCGIMSSYFNFFFFFQAEDGIRDLTVTGVQTCALPILYSTQRDFYTDDHRRLLDRVSEQASAVIHNSIVFEQTQEDSRSEERRVGKECRSRGAPEHEKKKKEKKVRHKE